MTDRADGGEPAGDVTRLVGRWEELRGRGQPVAAGELPGIRPELIREVEARIRALGAARGPLGLDSGGMVAPPDERAADSPGELPQVAGYEVLEELGRGGMGVVYKARQVSLDRVVALKMIRSGEYALAKERQRFQAEAKAVAALLSPGIVQVFDLAVHGGLPYFTMEFCGGGTLARRLDGAPLPPCQAAALVEQVARAVQTAHAKGIVHRDLKPSNVLFTEDGQPKVTDFGLAHRPEADRITRTGAILGTPSYMAPEQAEGGKGVGPSADVWALGAILYECLTGRPPFRGANPLETLDHVRFLDPVAPRLVRPGVPRDLETVCLGCLHKEPARRYASALALADDLGRWLRGERVRARRAGTLGQVWRWARRKPVVAGLAALLVVAVASGLLASLLLWRQSAHNAAREAAARREAEAHYALLRRLLANHAPLSTITLLGPRPAADPNPLPDSMLADAEACLSGLLHRRPHDHELRVLLAAVLTRLGSRQGTPLAPALFERAARLWEEVPPEAAQTPRHLAARAGTSLYLGAAYAHQGQKDLALRAYETSFRLWKEVARTTPGPLAEDGLFYTAYCSGQVLVQQGHSEEAVVRRLEALRRRRGPPGARGNDLLLDLLRAFRLCLAADGLCRSGRKGEALAAARQAAAALERHYRRPSPDGKDHLRAARLSTVVSTYLRRGGAPKEALALVGLVNRSLQELARAEPGAPHVFEELSHTWHHIGKERWQLGQGEGTVDALERALAAQRQACTLAPAVAESRRLLGSRYVQLARKLCELGRLSEAEARLRERQALWPGDPGKHEEALRELRKWAAQVGDGKPDLAPRQRQERRRYLDLWARLQNSSP